jgi:8-oxo-dGTP diphosphatase
MSAPAAITVVAAVVERDGKFLLTRRLKGTHLAGLWEFPGGKCEPGETHVACLERELVEELGVTAIVGREILATEHAYPERRVRLHFHACEIVGEPRPLLGQEMQWCAQQELRERDFPEADEALIDLLVTG